MKIVSRDACLQDRFRGVFARDQVLRCLIPGFFICNTALYVERGEHWVSDDYNVEFFDSFGKSPQFYGWDISGNVKYNKKTLQSLDSDVCGMYCLFFLYFRCRGLKMESILQKFSTNRVQNDRFVVDFVQLM
jgi:hypothetical protein